MRRFLILLSIGLLLSACTAVDTASQYVAPQFTEGVVVTAEVSGAVAESRLSSENGIKDAGLRLNTADGERMFQAKVSDGVISAEMTGLAGSTQYSCYFFITNGSYELCSETVGFTTKAEPVNPEEEVVEDPVFKRYLLSNFDLDGDGVLSKQELRKIRKIEVPSTDSIVSLKGIEKMVNLTELYASGSEIDGVAQGLLQTLDLSGNPNLQRLICLNNQINDLDLSKSPNIEILYCGGNNLTKLDVSNLEYLTDLRCYQSDFYDSGLDVSKNRRLRYLIVYETELRNLNVSNNKELITLNCRSNYLSELDISELKELTNLECSGNANIRHLDTTYFSQLLTLCVGDTKFVDFNLKSMPHLLTYNGNCLPFTELPDFSANRELTGIHITATGGAEFLPDSSTFFSSWPDLTELNASCYRGRTIDFSKNTKLLYFWMDGCPNLEELDLSASPTLKFISAYDNPKLKVVYVHQDVDISKLELRMYNCPAEIVHKTK